ncbi:ImmA/IrrE family metallo-endopeptidase [Globicatella sanguinis]
MRYHKLTTKLSRLHESHDPFVIAKNKGIEVIEENLGNAIYGYYNRHFNIRMIHINQNMSDSMKKFTCAHELGHAILHPKETTPALSPKTMVANLKIEREANEFATNLLIDGTHKMYEVLSTYDILDYYGIPYEMERFIREV